MRRNERAGKDKRSDRAGCGYSGLEEKADGAAGEKEDGAIQRERGIAGHGAARIKRGRRRDEMDRKAIARETLTIMEQGYYIVQPSGKDQETDSVRIDIKEDMEQSIRRSILITPDQGETILKRYQACPGTTAGAEPVEVVVEDIATVDAIRRLAAAGKERIGVLNFASAKNPGGGFINGAMAQEESLAASSTLYRTLTVHEAYYKANRASSSMAYTDHGIYSPDVVFFRDGGFRLTLPVKASVLTLPAVNLGQVLQKGQDEGVARRVMKRRMALALAIFAEQGAKTLVLGAYGCGVFRNDPRDVAVWWKELLEEGMGRYFDLVDHAVLDRSREQKCLRAFRAVWPG